MFRVTREGTLNAVSNDKIPGREAYFEHDEIEIWSFETPISFYHYTLLGLLII